MKQVTMFGVAVMMAVIGVTAGDYEVFVVGTGNNPKVDGNIVVWDESVITPGNGDILWRDLSDVQGLPQRMSLTAEQKTPSISGTMVVWQDSRNSITSGWDIYGWNLLEPISSVFPICTAAATQQTPVISGNRVVWADRRTNSTLQIYTASLPATGGQIVAATSTLQAEPAISGSIVVWRDARDSMNQIYKCDLSVTPFQAAPVYSAGTNQWRPAIHGNIVVWEDNPVSGSVTLMAYDLSKNQVVWSHSIINTVVNPTPAISGNLIVWQQTGTTNSDIRGYDLGKAQYLDVSVGSEDDKNPAISGRTVVWQRGNQILGTSIPLPTTVAITAPAGGAVLLAGSDVSIAWSLVEGDAPTAVDIQFSSDDGQTWQTIAENIPFADGAFVWDSDAAFAAQACRVQLAEAVTNTPLAGPGAAFTLYACDARLTADITGDCVVNLADLAAMSAQWLRCGNPHNADCSWD